jgi:hypothetical protein
VQLSFFTLLTLTSGICWTLVYLILINRGIKDKTYGMPFFALTFNLSWEFVFAFLITSGNGFGLQRTVNTIWFLFDVAIAYTYFRYGQREFPRSVNPKWFLPWSIAGFIASFAVIYVTGLEFPDSWGARYSAFTQNLMMSILFVTMLVRRDNVDGQSVAAAILKWIGTFAPTIQFYLQTGSNLILVLGLGCFFYDAIYTVMLWQKFRELGLHPLTRRPTA